MIGLEKPFTTKIDGKPMQAAGFVTPFHMVDDSPKLLGLSMFYLTLPTDKSGGSLDSLTVACTVRGLT